MVRRRSIKIKRSPHLVAYWRGTSLFVCNYATRVTTEATPLVCELLHVCHSWISIHAIRERTTAGGSLLPVLLDRLVKLTLLERSDRSPDPKSKAMSSLDSWNPEAGFFHFATRDVRFSSPREARRYAVTADRAPMPRPVKQYPAAKAVGLPRPESSAFTDVLLARRTSRRYSSVPVTLGELSSLLAFTAGVQQWATTEDGDVPLKTSPSGGARHPIECYVVARDVAGLNPAIYHYRADRHVLERIGGRVSIDRMKAYVPESGYFAKASAMVFFTAVFARQMWRYPYSRAYRAALVEAGHVCQTFLLTATSLGLAPYCVMGLADTLVEGDLGIDGITESVLYCAGVGRLPRGTVWAPLPQGTLKTRPNKQLLPRQ
jgi:SagB-type dehydrogenase family enzyme